MEREKRSLRLSEVNSHQKGKKIGLEEVLWGPVSNAGQTFPFCRASQHRSDTGEAGEVQTIVETGWTRRRRSFD